MFVKAEQFLLGSSVSKKFLTSAINVYIVIRNGKIIWKHGPYCWYFFLNLKYLGWPYGEYIKTSKNSGLCEELLSENDFEIVLVIFCCYDYCAKTVQKITADQEDNHKYSSSYILLDRQNIPKINNSEKRLVTRTPLTSLKMLQKLHRKKNNNWPMLSFIHNRSEITNCMRYSSKTKTTKSKATFLR